MTDGCCRDEIDEGIQEATAAADIALMLVSPDFLASADCHDVEMQRAVERHHHCLPGYPKLENLKINGALSYKETVLSPINTLLKNGRRFHCYILATTLGI
ncbi:hypothetical protein [Nitrospirillum viridazoti]|uniref:hypothetical protein n=1 Tax=Nitrospirillum viridazoti TaxID=3144925 RepID=UPI0011A2AC50|nr:hypothetical protein [Nitrospirillum amazonense]